MPSGGRCESDEGNADSLGDGGAGEASNSPDGAGVGEAWTVRMERVLERLRTVRMESPVSVMLERVS